MNRETLIRLLVPLLAGDGIDLNSAEECVRIAARAAEEVDRVCEPQSTESVSGGCAVGAGETAERMMTTRGA